VNNRGAREGTIKVRPGKYTVTFTHKGFASTSQETTVGKGETNYIGVVLASNSIDTAKWNDTHKSDAAKAEGITGKNQEIQAQKLQKKYPILKDLPFIDNEYRVDYGKSQQNPDDINSVAIYVTYYTDSGKQQAIDWMKFKGYDPTKLETIFVQKPFSF